MPYDPTTVSPSIVVCGVDLRHACGFEAQTVEGRDGLQLDRRSYTAPTRSGVISHGGRFEPFVISVSGWMPRANLDRLRRILSRDVAVPSYSARARYIQFFDDPDKVYVFDTVSHFTSNSITRNWGILDEINVSFDVTVTDAVGSFQSPGTYGLGNELAVGTSSHNFVVARSRDGRGASHFDRAKVRIRTTGATSLVSAERGLIADFDRTLSAKSLYGDTQPIEMEMHAPINIVGDGTFDDGTNDAWTATSCTKSAVSFVEENDVFTNQVLRARVLSGEYAMKVVGGTNCAVSQPITVTNGVAYVVRFETYSPGLSGTLTGRIRDHSGTILAERVLSGALQKWVFEEMTFTANSSTTHTVEIAYTHAVISANFWVNRVVVAASILSNPGIETGSTTPWTGSGITVAVESSIVRTGAKSLKATCSGASGMIQSSGLTLVSGSLYYLSGWVYRASGAGDIVVHGTSGVKMGVSMRPINGAWSRFSMPFIATGTSEQIYISFSAAAVMYFDDLAVTKLENRASYGALITEGGIHYEPGAFGFRVQVPVGECITSSSGALTPSGARTNPNGFALHGQFQPMLFQDAGAGLIAGVYAPGTGNCSSVSRDSVGVCGVYIPDSTDITKFAFAKRPAPAVTALKVAPRGALGACLRYDGLGLTGSPGLVVGIEKPIGGDETEPAFEQALSTVAPTVLRDASQTFSGIILGDGVAWDAFWVTEYPPSDDQMISEMMAVAVPPMRNRLLYIPAAGNYFIDLEGWQLEAYDHDGATVATRKTNAWSSASGDMLKFYGEHAVLYFDVNAPMVQILTERAP